MPCRDKVMSNNEEKKEENRWNYMVDIGIERQKKQDVQWKNGLTFQPILIHLACQKV